MALITSIRSENFKLFLSLKSEIKDAEKYINRLTKERGEYIPFFAHIAAPLMSSAAKSISIIVRCKLGQDGTLDFLKQAALALHRIVIRCADFASIIANKALNFYQKIINILPSGTTLQLELMGQGDYRRELEPPTLMLATIATWWKTCGQRFTALPKQAVSSHEPPLQLCLNLDETYSPESKHNAEEENIIAVTAKPVTSEVNPVWNVNNRVSVEGGCFGTITAIKGNKASIQWDNGYKATYSFHEMERYRYQKTDLPHPTHTN